MEVNFKRRAIELERYLMSRGEEVPPDYHNYKTGNINEDLCVFCDRYKAEDPVFRLDWRYSDTTPTSSPLDVRCCYDCKMNIDAMLAREAEDNSDIDAMDRYQNEQDIMNDYFRSLKFDKEIYKYYRHLNPKDDTYVDDKQCDKCFVCGNDDRAHKAMPYHMSVWNTISVPITNGISVMTGGKVWICPSCEGRLLELTKSKDLKVLEGHFLLLQVAERVKCKNCNTDYLISKDEADYRKQHPHLDFLCQDCAYETVLDENHVWTFSYENLSPRSSPLERWKDVVCSFCERINYIDLTATIESLEKHYFRGNDFFCNSCIQNGIAALLADSLTFNHHGNVYFVLTTLNGDWTYEIVRLHKKSSIIEHLHSNVLGKVSPAIAATQAKNEITLLFSGKQTELDYGDE